MEYEVITGTYYSLREARKDRVVCIFLQEGSSRLGRLSEDTEPDMSRKRNEMIAVDGACHAFTGGRLR